jgi:hypothetical protein
MARRTGWAAGRGGWVAGAVLGLLAAQPVAAQEAQPVAAQETPSPAPSHVRGADRKGTALVAAGIASSATFRAIIDALDRSDVIVYVETGPIRLPGQLQFLAATSVCRHVRVSVRIPCLDTDGVAWLAHELWHAVEISRAPEVRDQDSLRRLYERIGSVGRAGASVESGDAQDVWTKVLYEVRNVK